MFGSALFFTRLRFTKVQQPNTCITVDVVPGPYVVADSYVDELC